MTMTVSNANHGVAMTISTSPAFRVSLEPNDFKSAYQLAAMAASTGIGGVKTPEDALVRIMTGRTLGLSAMQSLALLFVVNGVPGMRAILMVALCRIRPECEYFECLESTAEKATYRTKRRGRPEQVLTWTIQQAHDAGLLTGSNKDTWRKYPPEMLRSRCSVGLARLEWAEAMLGLQSIEELTSGMGRGQGYDEMGAAEVTGEILQQVPVIVQPNPVPTPQAHVPPQAAQRDFAAESDAIKQRIVDAKTKDELKAVRAEAAAFVADAGEPWATQLRNFYSMATPKAPMAAPPPPPPPSGVSEVERPADAGDAREGAA